MDISSLRKEYRLKKLNRHVLRSDPFEQFKVWLQEAIQAGSIEANAFALSTADRQGIPHSRMVLMKHFNERGFVFFTNMKSNKARELNENGRTAGLFWWNELERQVRFEGSIEKASQEDTVRYFATRPRRSQIGAWASQQDEIVPSRDELEKKYRDFEEKYQGKEVPSPPYWGGFWIVPTLFEFWQGREDRLHDRFRYTKQEEGWLIERLSP